MIHTDLYVPGRLPSPATTPGEALERLLTAHYPQAARATFVDVAESQSGAVKYHARSRGGHLLANVLVSQVDGEYFVQELALCERTAKGWAR
ncbi:MAG TPA: hypothetical protein VF519_00895 [Mycobacteriales bacterium]